MISRAETACARTAPLGSLHAGTIAGIVSRRRIARSSAIACALTGGSGSLTIFTTARIVLSSFQWTTTRKACSLTSAAGSERAEIARLCDCRSGLSSSFETASTRSCGSFDLECGRVNHCMPNTLSAQCLRGLRESRMLPIFVVQIPPCGCLESGSGSASNQVYLSDGFVSAHLAISQSTSDNRLK